MPFLAKYAVPRISDHRDLWQAEYAEFGARSPAGKILFLARQVKKVLMTRARASHTAATIQPAHRAGLQC